MSAYNNSHFPGVAERRRGVISSVDVGSAWVTLVVIFAVMTVLG